MWAFAIWDKKERRLILCRDRMGVKPLYWYFKDGLFMFTSELKAFHKHPRFKKELDPQATALYFKYSYIPSPHCIFANAGKLEPGCYLVVNENQEFRTHRYWNIDDYFSKGRAEKKHWSNRPEREVADELEAVLLEGFKLRMVSDVPVGMFLSGGIDSSLVTALLQKEYSNPLKTFTIGFQEKSHNEAVWAKKIATHLGTDHTELYCSPKEAFDVIPKLSEIYDEPFGDSSGIPTFLVSRLARQKVKVALSADGGDEQFCGYPRYLNVARMARLPFRKSLASVLQLISPSVATQSYRMLRFALPDWKNFEDKYSKMRTAMQEKEGTSQFDVTKSYFLRSDLRQLGVKDVDVAGGVVGEAGDVITELMRMDMKHSLIDDMLAKVDRASMSLSLENRDPLLDNKIVEYSSRMPIELKYRNGKTKYILRQILYKYVPQHLVDRPKMGFEIPIHDWFKQDLKPVYMDYLNKERIRRGGLFNEQYIEKLCTDYFDNKMVDAHKLWLLCTFEMWREKWMN
jgi:asparagine synthase (glutamine-hydrolysing)